jgi:cardiolipin synthase (CMP-forming)
MIKLNKINTVSNHLSLLRLIMVVPFWILLDFFPSYRYILLSLVLFASLTDILDGYLARKMNQITEFGKIIDPLADKVCIGLIITKLFLIHQIPGYYFYMIIGRDILIFIGGIILARKSGRVLPSNILGKVTVLLIGIIIIFILLQVDINSILFKSFYYVSLLLIVVSFAAYVLRAIEFFKTNPILNNSQIAKITPEKKDNYNGYI